MSVSVSVFVSVCVHSFVLLRRSQATTTTTTTPQEGDLGAYAVPSGPAEAAPIPTGACGRLGSVSPMSAAEVCVVRVVRVVEVPERGGWRRQQTRTRNQNTHRADVPHPKHNNLTNQSTNKQGDPYCAENAQQCAQSQVPLTRVHTHTRAQTETNTHTHMKLLTQSTLP